MIFLALVLLVIPVVTSFALAHVNPITTSFIAQDKLTSLIQDHPQPAYEWVDIDAISRDFLVALVAHEDQSYVTRDGPFIWNKFWERVQAATKGESDPSGSTIHQQVTKNLYFWRHRDWVRKGLEADYSFWLSRLVSRKRVLELYANSIEFVPGVYGVCAASWYYFDTAPRNLNVRQSAALVGLMPNPAAYRRGPEGGVVYQPVIRKRDGKLEKQGDLVAWSLAHINKQITNVGRNNILISLGISNWTQGSNEDTGCSGMPESVARLLKFQGEPNPLPKGMRAVRR
jgi:monofunctional biosynthetic peptidoglycan transglycosylase